MKRNRRVRLRDALGKYRAKVTLEDYKLIREKYFGLGRPAADLAREYSQYSRETIRRILGKERGYVLLRGSDLADQSKSA